MSVSSIDLGDSRLRFADVRRRVKAIFIGSVGNLVEWYDFYVYTAFALYFANSFFPGSDPVVQQLNAAMLFAFGFIVRPIGGWLFGHLGRIGGARSVAQRRRRIGDRQLLSWLVDRIPYEQVARPALAGVARRVLDPPLRLYRRGLLAVIRW